MGGSWWLGRGLGLVLVFGFDMVFIFVVLILWLLLLFEDLFYIWKVKNRVVWGIMLRGEEGWVVISF